MCFLGTKAVLTCNVRPLESWTSCSWLCLLFLFLIHDSSKKSKAQFFRGFHLGFLFQINLFPLSLWQGWSDGTLDPLPLSSNSLEVRWKEKLMLLEQHDHHLPATLVLLPLHAISLLLLSFSSPGKREACGSFGNLVEYIFACVSKQQISCNPYISNFTYFLSFLKARKHGLSG